MNIKNFVLSKKIHETGQSILYQGYSLSQNRKVIVKQLKKESANEQQILRFKREYDISKSLNENGTVAVYEYEADDKINNYYFTMEDYSNTTLKEFMNSRALANVEIFLRLALDITQALEAIHQHKIIHKDLNAYNILYNQTKGVKIIDFGIASCLPKEEFEIQHFETLEGNLAYISPEQTGRMNRSIDYRTDYYSLGVIFYEMATGILPFVSDDMLEMIHCHIAKSPIPPSEINPNLPKMISEIILKLMSKSVEDRYQSTFGIKADLEKCLKEWQETKKIETFKLGSSDVSLRFQIPEKMYGREKEKQILFEVYDKVCSNGESSVVLVSGHAGVGKTRFIHEIYKPNALANGFFISGKYDQYNKNIPYSALIQALQELIQRILTENETTIHKWRAKLNQALENNGNVVLNSLPDLEKIIGPQPPLQELGLEESKNRFKYVFKKFIHSLASKEQPLVIFLDDFQWADISSLDLLEMLLNESKHILLLGSYRDNEVDLAHPLTKLIKELDKNNITVTSILLKPLELQNVEDLLADTLHRRIEDIKELAHICFIKTQGNAFFLLQFLQTLFKNELIQFDLQKGEWRWDGAKIAKKGYTDNVVEFMEQKVRELPLETQKTLQLASCLGNRFDLKTLSSVRGLSANQVADELWIALQEGLVLPLDESYQTVTDKINISYQFLHDRVQQAAYSLIKENEKETIHLMIGRMLLEKTPESVLNKKIMTITNHINFGLRLVSDEKEKINYANLNLLAGIKAKASIAYKQANAYITTGLSLLSKESWAKHYDLMLALSTQAFETAYLTNDKKVMDEYANTILSHAKSLQDKVNVYELNLNYLATHQQFEEGVDLALKALKLFGVSIPKHPSKFAVGLALVKTKLLLATQSWRKLANLPPMTDPHWLAAMRIGAAAGTVCILWNPFLAVFLVHEAIKITLKYGVCPLSANSYVSYGMLVSSILKNPKQGYLYGQLGIQLAERFNFESQKPQTYLVANICINPWYEHLNKFVPDLPNKIQHSLSIGDLSNAGYLSSGYISQLIFYSKNLRTFLEECNQYAHLMRSYDLNTPYQYLICFWLIALYVSQSDPNQLNKLESEFNFDWLLAKAIASKDESEIVGLYCIQLYKGYFLEEQQNALSAALAVDNYLDSFIGFQVISVMVYLFSSLILLKAYPKAGKEKKVYLALIEKYLDKLKFRAKYAPMNFLHIYYLVKAQYAATFKYYKKAEKYFELAINKAHENDYIYVEAMANELMAKMYFKRKKDNLARLYINQAYYSYNRWGSLAKVKKIQDKYRQFLWIINPADNIKSIIDNLAQSRNIPNLNATFDLSTIIKSTQTLSKEIILNILLKKMMKIVIENAGAKTGYFLMEKEGQWYIEAEGGFGEEPKVLCSLPIRNMLPESIVNYVINTQKAVLLDDATEDKNFVNDPYIKLIRPKSILCMPLLRKGELAGILYLENRLSRHVFTEDRLDLLQLLTSQIIISIDNAKMYKDIFELNKELSDANKSLFKLNQAYARFVPQQFLNLLGKTSIVEVTEDNHTQKDMTVMFSDIRNYTAMSEKMTPEENFKFINEFIRNIAPEISAHAGFIDKYYGDGMMALFGKADDALKASISILQSLKPYNKMRKELNKPEIKIGIGLNSGKLMLGTVGIENRMDVTVISDAVNAASRVENATKDYHTTLLITDEVYSRLKNPDDYAIRRIDIASVRGKNKPVILYEVFNADNEETKKLKLSTKKDFEAAVDLYHDHEFELALDMFKKILAINKFDATARYYCKQCLAGIRKLDVNKS